MLTETAIKRSKIYGYLFAILGAFTAAMAALFLLCACVDFDSVYNAVIASYGVSTDEYDATAVGITLGLVIAYLAVIAILYLFLGVRGVRTSKAGHAEKSGYIKAAWVLFVLTILSAVSALITMFQAFSASSVTNLLIDIVWAWITFDYIQAAKTLAAAQPITDPAKAAKLAKVAKSTKKSK